MAVAKPTMLVSKGVCAKNVTKGRMRLWGLFGWGGQRIPSQVAAVLRGLIVAKEHGGSGSLSGKSNEHS